MRTLTSSQIFYSQYYQRIPEQIYYQFVFVSNFQLESSMLHLQILGPVCSSIIGILMENSHGDPSPLEYCLTQKVLGLETPLGLREEWIAYILGEVKR